MYIGAFLSVVELLGDDLHVIAVRKEVYRAHTGMTPTRVDARSLNSARGDSSLAISLIFY